MLIQEASLDVGLPTTLTGRRHEAVIGKATVEHGIVAQEDWERLGIDVERREQLSDLSIEPINVYRAENLVRPRLGWSHRSFIGWNDECLVKDLGLAK